MPERWDKLNEHPDSRIASGSLPSSGGKFDRRLLKRQQDRGSLGSGCWRPFCEDVLRRGKRSRINLGPKNFEAHATKSRSARSSPRTHLLMYGATYKSRKKTNLYNVLYYLHIIAQKETSA